MLNKKIVLVFVCISIQVLIASCSPEVKTESESTQINNESIYEKDLIDIAVRKTQEPSIDEAFCKELLIRLIHDDIGIKEGDNIYYFSDDFSSAYIEKLKDSSYYIVDIDADGVLDIGINFPTNVLTTYKYDQNEDLLIPSIGLHIYTEILGDGQHMLMSSSAYQTTYFYVVMVNGKRTLEISFGKELVGMSTLEDGTEEPVFEYTVNSVKVTLEQWELLSEPLWELRKNGPRSYTYEDVMNENN